MPPLLRLQQTAGNQAVVALVGGDPGVAVQRVPVTAPTRQETLFNQRGGGTASANVYGGSSGATFDMSRGGSPEVVTVTVRIRFIDQARGLSAPDASGNQRPVDTGTPTVIPPGDPRRAFAQNICATAPAHWSGRAVLVSRRRPPSFPESMWSSDTGGPVRLPVVFRAVPVWDLTSPADKEIRVFGGATQAGGPTHPIDAGHYYMNKGPNYPFNEEAIYAHEYGHLIGLPDEYSHSNPQMHALLHDIDPGTSAARGAAMDRATVRQMVVAALTRQLSDRVSAASGEISAAFSRAKGPVVAALGGSLRGALGDAGVQSLLAVNLPPSHARLAPRIPRLVQGAAQAWGNTHGVARSVVASELAPAAIGTLVNQLYWNALSAAQGAVDIGGINMKVNIEGNAGITSTGNAVSPPTGLWNAATAGPLAANAGAVVDRVAGPLQTGRTPPVRASGSLLRQIESLPGGWAAFASGAPASLSAGTLQSDLASTLLSAWIARLGTIGPAPITRSDALARAVSSSVRAAARATATNAMRAFLNAELNPVLQSSVRTLMSAVTDEVTMIMGSPADKLAVTSPRDPDLQAMATNLHAQLQAQVTAAQAAQGAAPGTTPVNPGTTAPAQQVTYSTVGMMSDNTDVFRQDQFTHLARLFNDTSGLRHSREDPFTVEMA